MIIEYIGRPAMLEQTAEECAELAHACLKLARILRGENPTPADFETVTNNLTEEWTDLTICATELKLMADEDIIKRKLGRFNKRLEEFGYKEAGNEAWDAKREGELKD